MKYLLAASLFFLSAVSVDAFNPIITEVSRPYEVVTIKEDAGRIQEYLGELEGSPVMYEITSDEPFVLQAHVRQRYRAGTEPVEFSLIAIRQNERGGGVTEIQRQRPELADWQRRKDSLLGLVLWESPGLSSAVEPGTYRVEISTPDNTGKYLLSFGTEPVRDGYFKTLTGIARTQQFFGFSFLRLLSSSYVYYPIGIILGLFVTQRVWSYRRLLSKK